MTDKNDVPATAEKDPDDWTTGDEPMTGAQKSYLQTLAQEAGEELGMSRSTVYRKIAQYDIHVPRVGA